MVKNTWSVILFFIMLLSVGTLNAQDKDLSIVKLQVNYDSLVTLPQESGTEYEELKLRNNIRNILLEVYYPGEYIYYSFFLDGYDREWSDWTKYPVKEYTNLVPGDYVLRVRAGANGVVMADEELLRFRKMQPFYLHGLALMLYGIIALFAAWFIYRALVRRHVLKHERLEAIIKERTEELQAEKEKTENLLANVLPKTTAAEIMSKGKATKHKYNFATVLFSDIQGFTKIAEEVNPEELIDELDQFFFHFDSVAEKYNIEKIKTIGDAYMCAGGIPQKNRTNPVEVTLAALEMQEYMARIKNDQAQKGLKFWDIRIGIHTGNVIAGVVGHKKLSYDIWGDTVNTASRMESSGEAGKINVSGVTYDYIKEFFICEYRGKMPVKYKGELDMYFVKGIRPELREGRESKPNEQFRNKILSLKIQDLEDHFFEKYEVDASSELVFNDVKYLRNICTQAELLGRAEGLGDYELICLRLASVFVKSGYMKAYSDLEINSVDMMKEMALEFGFGEECISIAARTITEFYSGKPQSDSSMILSDSVYDYYGRIDFSEMILSKYKEEAEFLSISSMSNWIKKEEEHLVSHEFYTTTAKMLRSVSKDEQMASLKEVVKK